MISIMLYSAGLSRIFVKRAQVSYSRNVSLGYFDFNFFIILDSLSLNAGGDRTSKLYMRTIVFYLFNL